MPMVSDELVHTGDNQELGHDNVCLAFDNWKLLATLDASDSSTTSNYPLLDWSCNTSRTPSPSGAGPTRSFDSTSLALPAPHRPLAVRSAPVSSISPSRRTASGTWASSHRGSLNIASISRKSFGSSSRSSDVRCREK